MPSVVEDRDEIRQLMYRYGHTWDNQDAHGWVNVFTEDGVYWEGGGPVFKGHEELYWYARDTQPRFSGRFHIVTNQLIDVEGDTAKAHSYFLIVEGLAPCLSGTYDDKIVRTANGWRFAERIVTCLYPGGFPIAGNDMASWVFSSEVGGGWQHRSMWRAKQYSLTSLQS
jgi:ketosteroid isomerase-like protein